MDHGKKLGETKHLRLLLIVDEAQHIAPSRRDYEGILEKYANEFRKFGMGLLVIATRPTQVSEDIIANANTIVCHSLTSAKDTELVLNYVVSRLEIDSNASSMRKLDVGECLVQLNDAKEPVPVTCKVGLPEHASLFSSLPTQGGPLPKPISAAFAPSPLLEVPEDDSALTIYGRLPSWARETAKLVHESGGRVSVKAVQRSLESRKKLKQVVHGRHPLLEPNGTDLVLTRLGEKVVAIEFAGRTQN
jgi:hypothetical protein